MFNSIITHVSIKHRFYESKCLINDSEMINGIRQFIVQLIGQPQIMCVKCDPKFNQFIIQSFFCTKVRKYVTPYTVSHSDLLCFYENFGMKVS